jgi:predicted DNA-binding transcriptional regulator AlpA
MFETTLVPQILSLRQAAGIAGVSVSTLLRRMAAGEGPQVTRLSPRRCGVRVDHLRQWLDDCASCEPKVA